MRKIRTPYLLLLPGFAFLFTFFILPIINLAQTSTQTKIAGGDTGQYEQTLRFANYFDAFIENREQFSRSFIYALLATLLALAISYPLAYAIAFKSGKYKNVLLVLVVAPFFTSFLLRTIAWKQIYANGITTFRKVTLPLSMPGVVAGTLLTFIPAAGDYVNAAILGSPNTKMLGNVIESRYFRVVDYPTAAALSFTLMLAILILVTLYIRKAGTEELV